MNKQTKLIITGVAIIGGGILLYSLLKPKKNKIDVVNKDLIKDKLQSIASNKPANILPAPTYSKTLINTRSSAF
jgi:hypothetical protein